MKAARAPTGTDRAANASRTTGRRAAWVLGLLLAASAATRANAAEAEDEALPFVVGSKAFTESVILGEMATALAADAGAAARHARQLGGTEVLWAALLGGEIDAYPEYTGTLLQEILAAEALPGADALPAALAAHGVVLSAPLGFNNTYALGLPRQRATALGITSISDLAEHPDLRFAFGHEFLQRGDGWPALRAAYGLPQLDVRGVDHDLAYRGLVSGDIDVMDLYSTDAEIAALDLAVLRDDRGHFPVYDAVFLLRADAAQQQPAVFAALQRLAGRLDEADMIALNGRVRLGGVSESRVAADALADKLGLIVSVHEASLGERLAARTREHLQLVGISLGAALLVALPLGIVAARRPRWRQLVLAVVGLVQTVPSLALLVFMIPLLGIGGPPAIVALFLYSLLPIVRNTATGLTDIAPELLESADALGLPPRARLRLVELPLASRSILAGIKTAAVINVGTATLGAFIGAGGYGQPILTGIRLHDTALLMEGAVPAALLALAVQGLFELAERRLVPRGLRL